MVDRQKGGGQVTHHVGWGSGCLPGTHPWLETSTPTRPGTAPSLPGETAPTQRAKGGEPQERVPSPS